MVTKEASLCSIHHWTWRWKVHLKCWQYFHTVSTTKNRCTLNLTEVWQKIIFLDRQYGHPHRQLLLIHSTLNYKKHLWTQECTSQITGMTVQLYNSTAGSHKILNPECILCAAKIKLTNNANKLVHVIKTDVTWNIVHNLTHLCAHLIK